MRWARTGSRHTSGVLATPPSTSLARRNAGRVLGWTAHSGRDPRGTAGSVAQRQCRFRVSSFERAGERAALGPSKTGSLVKRELRGFRLSNGDYKTWARQYAHLKLETRNSKFSPRVAAAGAATTRSLVSWPSAVRRERRCRMGRRQRRRTSRQRQSWC